MNGRIALVGAASLSHGRRLLNDLFTFPWIDSCTLALMAPHREHLDSVTAYARRLASRNGFGTNVSGYTELRTAIEGSDIVFLLYDAGGFAAFDRDFRIARAFGIDMCIGDTMGPTGTMKALRNIAVLGEVAEEIRRSCPEAIVVNYVNPMAPMTMAAEQLGLRNFVGICGGVQATIRTIAACLEEEAEELETRFAGINHMTWALEIRRAGRDLYPVFRERMLSPRWRAAEPARAEVLQHFRYFVTETCGHLSDFFPWFRSTPSQRRRYAAGPAYSGASGAYHRVASYIHRRLGRVDPLAYEDGTLEPRSEDAGPRIADAWLTGGSVSFYGNVINTARLIDNLPEDAAVEVPVEIDSRSIEGGKTGALPEALAALCRTNITTQRLMTRGSLQQDPELLLSGISLDPLTAASTDLPAIRRLAEQLIAANRRWLPDLAGDYHIPDIEIRADPEMVTSRSDWADVLEPVRRFDRQRRKRSEHAANRPGDARNRA